ncbi:hypothetical protein [Rhodoferax ferrireducens]|uniref:hypothetical protein n=1 Tax=Rhodoferax ferrireducens TaxID=192843 RepID=UPI000E0D7352|nr:hypothetical protein [Rhodoferax ferrireducens]
MIKLITASPASGMSLSDFCSPPAAKTESIQGLAALVDSGQAGGIRRHPMYAPFYENRHLWVKKFCRLRRSINEVLWLQSAGDLSTEAWVDCDTALRDSLREIVREATDYGLLLFLVAESA